MSDTPQVIKFKASFPSIQSAIRVGQDGMRIQLDIPETELVNAIELLACRGVVLNVTIEAEPPQDITSMSFGDIGDITDIKISDIIT